MEYTQITSEERVIIALMRWQGYSNADIARLLGRHRSSIGREIARNCCNDGAYRAVKAESRTRTRRSSSRRNFRIAAPQYAEITRLLRKNWSPEQIAGYLKRRQRFQISHETIYRYVWWDRAHGGSLHRHLRQADKQRRKRYNAYDSRGRLPGKRHISERPRRVELRSEIGHWEIDTVMGDGDQHCVLTLVERATGFALIGKCADRTARSINRRLRKLIAPHLDCIKTITADNGTEFHSYKDIERATGIRFYFATPHHSWERGSNENFNGLLRQYLPKRTSMASVSQRKCEDIADKLNHRPRKRYDYETPAERFA